VEGIRYRNFEKIFEFFGALPLLYRRRREMSMGRGNICTSFQESPRYAAPR
jgi:hypothetical protein